MYSVDTHQNFNHSLGGQGESSSFSQTLGGEQCGLLPDPVMLSESGTLRFEDDNTISTNVWGSQKLHLPLQDKRRPAWNPKAQLTALQSPYPLQPQCAHLEKGDYDPAHIQGAARTALVVQ